MPLILILVGALIGLLWIVVRKVTLGKPKQLSEIGDGSEWEVLYGDGDTFLLRSTDGKEDIVYYERENCFCSSHQNFLHGVYIFTKKYNADKALIIDVALREPGR